MAATQLPTMTLNVYAHATTTCLIIRDGAGERSAGEGSQ